MSNNQGDSGRLEAAKKRLAAMQDRLGAFLPKPVVEIGVERGEKHPSSNLPLLDPQRTGKQRRV
jgi:hypothetical protein